MWATLRDFITEYDSFNHLAERKCIDSRDLRLIAAQYNVQADQVQGVFNWCLKHNHLADHPQPTP